MTATLSGKRILIAEDNEWIAAGLLEAINGCDGIALGPAQTVTAALALIHELPDGAILDANLLDGPITPVARALLDKFVPVVVFTGLGLPADLQEAHSNIMVILKPAPSLTVIQALADRMTLARNGNSSKGGPSYFL